MNEKQTLTDEQIMAIWRKCDQPSEENDFTTGPLTFYRAILAAQQPAAAPCCWKGGE